MIRLTLAAKRFNENPASEARGREARPNWGARRSVHAVQVFVSWREWGHSCDSRAVVLDALRYGNWRVWAAHM